MMQTRPMTVTVWTILVLVAAVPSATWAQEPPTDILVLEVDGMWNQKCENYVENNLLGDRDGVYDVVADHENDRVTVEFDPAQVSTAELAAAIVDCPMFDVTGSPTHSLDDEAIERFRQDCTCACERHKDRNV